MFERPKNGESAILVSLNIDDIDHKENTSEFKLLAFLTSVENLIDFIR